MTTWEELREDARGILQDDQAPYAVTDRLLRRYANYGLNWIATRHSQTLTTTLSVVNGLFPLPAGWLATEAIYAHGEAQQIDQLPLHGPFPLPGHAVHLDPTQIRLGDKTVSEVEFCYRSAYAPLDDDEDEIPVDTHLEEALLYYIAARGFSQRAAGSANLDQFDRKSDSGKPTDNPLLQMADHYMKQARLVLDTYQPRAV